MHKVPFGLHESPIRPHNLPKPLLRCPNALHRSKNVPHDLQKHVHRS